MNSTVFEMIIRVFGAFLSIYSFAVLLQVPRRFVLQAGIVGAIGGFVYLLAIHFGRGDMMVAVGTVVVVQLAVVVVDGVLLHDDGLALMDIERLPGQNQAEELVAARTDGADLADGLIIGKDRHETGDAALDLDLKQDVGLGQTALGAGRHDVVDHHGGDALALGVVSTLRLTGQDVGLIVNPL